MRELDPDLRALQEVRDAVRRCKTAVHAIQSYTQAQTDRLCEAMAKAGAEAAYELARVAVEETGIGRVHYKILKNLAGTELTWASIKDEKTVGIVKRDEAQGVYEVATPAGVIAGIVPTTNPTSTAMFKSLIAVKGRNGMVISPHPRAKRCIGESVEVLRRAIERAGGPPDLLQSLSNPTIESTGALMRHRDVALILATGGTGLVQAAYSSGKPAYGVGPGNVPVYIDRSADIAAAARHITASQSFDNATLCCSEQALVLDRPIADAFLAEMKRRGAYLCDERETELLAKLCNRRGAMNADVVGQDPWKVAQMAGFQVPRATSVLLAHQGGVGKDWPLTIEILCPVLSVHMADGWRDGCRICIETLEFDGLGHTLGVHCRDEAVLEAFFLEKPANRIIVNGPCSEGSVGYSTNLVPSMSLGCGPQAGNISSDNITARHLIAIKRVAYVRRDWDANYARDHARAAALSGDRAPRGSGLPGDPALGGGAAAVSSSSARDVTSNWQGNPSLTAPSTNGQTVRPSASQAMPGVAPKPARPGGAPTFTTSNPAKPVSNATPSGMTPKVGAAPKAFAATPPTATKAASPRPGGNAAVGGSLSTAEIRSILSHAGAGCPLGPCKGCPHHEVTTGACKA